MGKAYLLGGRFIEFGKCYFLLCIGAWRGHGNGTLFRVTAVQVKLQVLVYHNFGGGFLINRRCVKFDFTAL